MLRIAKSLSVPFLVLSHVHCNAKFLQLKLGILTIPFTYTLTAWHISIQQQIRCCGEREWQICLKSFLLIRGTEWMDPGEKRCPDPRWTWQGKWEEKWGGSQFMTEKTIELQTSQIGHGRTQEQEDRTHVALPRTWVSCIEIRKASPTQLHANAEHPVGSGMGRLQGSHVWPLSQTSPISKYMSTINTLMNRLNNFPS